MRLVRNLAVAGSITEYDATVRRGKVHQDMINEIFLPKMYDKINYIVDITLMNKLASGNPGETEINSILQNILLVHDKTELIRFVNWIKNYSENIGTQLNFITRDKEAAQRLLVLIKKEYYLN